MLDTFGVRTFFNFKGTPDIIFIAVIHEEKYLKKLVLVLPTGNIRCTCNLRIRDTYVNNSLERKSFVRTEIWNIPFSVRESFQLCQKT